MALGSLGAVTYDVVAHDKTKEGLNSAEARAKKMNATALKVGVGMTAVGVGAKLMADNINASYLTFDSAMAEVKSLGGVTQEQMDIMRSSAIGISKELPLSAANVANGFYMMRSAGFDAARVIEELPAIAEMAVAGNLEMADAVNSVTMVLDTYGERAGTAADITNVLMGTVQGFKTTLPELQMQLSKNVGVAASLGIEFHELAAMSGMLKKEFVSAEEAGTAMKTMLLRLTDPKVTAEMEAMGIEVKDNNGNFVGMQSVLDGLSTKLEAAGGDVEQMAILQKLFGTEGLRAAMSLIRQKDSLADFSEQVNAGVSVQEALNAVLESTQSQLTIAENKMDAAKIQLGEGMAPATIFAANSMAAFAGVLEGMPGPLQTVIGSAIKMSESFIAIGPALAGLVPTIQALRAAHAGATIAAYAHTAAQWLLNTSLYACPLVWIVLAIGGVVAALYVLEKKFGVVTAAVELLSGAINAVIGFFGGVVDAIRGVVVDTDELAEANRELAATEVEVEEAEVELEAALEGVREAEEDVAEAAGRVAEAQLAVAKAAKEVDVLTEAYDELAEAVKVVDDLTEEEDDLQRRREGNLLSIESAEIRLAEAKKEHGAGSLEARKADLALRNARDSLDDTNKKIIETQEEMGKADTNYNDLVVKNGGKTAEEIKAQLDKSIADNKEGLEYMHAQEIEYAAAVDVLEEAKATGKKWEDILEARKIKSKDIAEEIELIQEGEVVATESAMGRIKAIVETYWSDILNIITPGGLFAAGQKAISGFIEGIKSKSGDVGDAVDTSFKEAEKEMPHSDAEEGPFSHLTESGRSVIETFSKGIESAKASVGGSFGEAFNTTPIGGAGGSSGGNTYGGDSISIGNVSLSRDYDFPALMKDIENYQSKKRVQRGIRTL